MSVSCRGCIRSPFIPLSRISLFLKLTIAVSATKVAIAGNLHRGARQLSLSVLPLEIGPQVSILSLDEIIETLTDAVSTSYGQGSKIDSSMNIEHGKNGTKDDGGNVDEGSSITKQLLRQILIKPIPARFN